MGFHPWLIMGNPVGVFNCPQSKSTGAARGYLWEFPSGKPVKLQRSLTIHGFYPWFSMGFPSGKTRLSPSGAFFSTGAARGYVWDFPSGNPFQPQRGFTIHGRCPWLCMGFPFRENPFQPQRGFFFHGRCPWLCMGFPFGKPASAPAGLSPNSHGSTTHGWHSPWIHIA